MKSLPEKWKMKDERREERRKPKGDDHHDYVLWKPGRGGRFGGQLYPLTPFHSSLLERK